MESKLIFQGTQDSIVKATKLPPLTVVAQPSYNNYSPAPRWGASSGRGRPMKRSYGGGNGNSFNGGGSSNKRTKFD